MMRPVHYQINSGVSGRGQPIPLDRYVNGYALAVTLNPSNMSINYTIKYSMHDPNYKNPNLRTPWKVSYKTSATWFNSDDPVMVNQSANRTSNFSFPPMGTLVSCTIVSGGTATYHIIPVGMDGE